MRNGIALEVIGTEGLPWVPFLTTMFMFIFVGNIFEVIPGIQFPVNSRTAIPAFLAGLVWILFNVAGVRAQGLGRYLKSNAVPAGRAEGALHPGDADRARVDLHRAAAHAHRPSRGQHDRGSPHLDDLLPGDGVPAGQAVRPSRSRCPRSFLSVLLLGFEILVAVLQAYIFTILTAVYISGAIHPEH